MSAKLELLNEIEHVFAVAPVPRATDFEGASLEALRAIEFFGGRPWTEITLQLLKDEYPGDPSACLEFLPAAIGLYYLPAFLCICIDSYYDADVIPDTLERQLAENPEQVSHFMSESSRLGAQQQRAVARVLRYLADVYENEMDTSGAAKALVQYWERFLS